MYGASYKPMPMEGVWPFELKWFSASFASGAGRSVEMSA